MEDLLPSEIARLVLGYLQEESCEEVAKCFLEKSPHLAECLRLSRMGRKFTTKVSGYSLSDVLEEFCSVYSIVQEQLSSLPPGNEQLKHGSLADQLKHLFKAQCPVQVKITLNSQQNGQSSSNGESVSELVTSTPRVRNSRKSLSRFQNVLDQGETYLDPSPAALPPPDATPLESLPGNSGQAVIGNTDVLRSEAANFGEAPGSPPSTANFGEVETYADNTSANPNSVGDKHLLTFSAPPLSENNMEARTMNPTMYSLPEQDVQYSSSFMPAPPDQSELPGSSNDYSKLKASGCSSKKTATTPGRKQTEEPAEAVDVSVLKRALLSNPDLQTRLAENINSVILSKDPVAPTPVKTVPESAVVTAATLADVTSALDEVIPTIVERTEADPVFERFLEEFFILSDTGKSNDGATATQENGSKSGKKKNTKAAGGKDADTSAQNTSADNFIVPPPVGMTPAKLEIEAAVAAASLNPMTPMTSKLINSLTNPTATPPTDPKAPLNCVETSSAEPSPSEAGSELTKNEGNQRKRKKGKPTNSKSKSPVFAKSIATETIQPPPLDGQKVQRANQIMNTFIPIAPRPLPARPPSGALQLTVSEGRITSCSRSGQRSWRGACLKENLIVTVNPEPIVATVTLPPHAEILPANIGILPVNRNLPANIATLPANTGASHLNTGALPANIPTLPANIRTLPANSRTVPANIRTLPANSGTVPANSGTVSANSGTVSANTGALPSNTGTLPGNLCEAVPEPIPTAYPEQSQPIATSSIPPPDNPAPTTTLAQESKKDKPAETASSRNVEDSRDISIVGRTPAFQPEVNTRRLSLSTPRRRHSHIRALDFNTPPKDDLLPTRKANTSPKNVKALSPNSSKALIQLSAKRRGELSKEERNSKAKAHLFSSPEYTITSSSGFKPNDNISEEDISGIAAIREPVKPKAKKAWDEDLRASFATLPSQPPPKPKQAPKRKRKGWTVEIPEENPQPEPPQKKKKNDPVNTSVANESAQSDHGMGNLLEVNVMNFSANSLNKSADAQKDSTLLGQSSLDQTSIMSHTTDDSREVNSSVDARAETEETVETRTVEPPLEPVAVPTEQTRSPLKKLSPIVEEAQKQPQETSVHIPVRSASCLSFLETPMKNQQPSVPPTPSIFSPNTAAQDTPITKLLRAHMPTMTYTAPSPSMPVTPSIKNINEVSPLSAAAARAAAYFKACSPTRETVRKVIMDDSIDRPFGRNVSNDSLEGELIRECNRIEVKKATFAPTLAKANSSMESSPEKSAESALGQQHLDSSVSSSRRKHINNSIFGDDDDNDDDVNESAEALSKDENKKSGAPASTTKAKLKKGSPVKISNKKGAKQKNPPRKPKTTEETEVCSETMRAKLFAMQGSDIEEALNRLHGNADDSYHHLVLLSPLPETPMKDDPTLIEISSATKSKTPAKSTQKTPLKVILKTPLKLCGGDTKVRPKKTPLKLKTPSKSKTPHKSAVLALDKLIDSAKKSTKRVDPNQTSGSSSTSASSSSSSSESSSDTDSDSSESDEASPVKNPQMADVSGHQPEDPDRQPLKASTPRTKKSSKQTPEVPDNLLLSPIRSKEAGGLVSSQMDKVADTAPEKNGPKEDEVIEPQVVEESKSVRKEVSTRTERVASTVLNENINAEKNSVNEVRGPSKDGPAKVVVSAPSRIATKPTLRRRGAIAKKPVADKASVQPTSTSRIPLQDKDKTTTPVVTGNVEPSVSKQAEMDDEDVFVQKKKANQRELIGTLQSKERIADKTIDKQNAEYLEEKKRRMILRLKNPPEKAPRRKTTKAEVVGSSAENEVPAIRQSIDEVSPQPQKPGVRRSKSANGAEQPEVKAAKVTDARSKSEDSAAAVSEDVLQHYITSDEEDTPISELRKELKMKPTEPVAAISTKATTSMPPKQRLKTMNVQDCFVKEKELKRRLEETKAPPKKRIQKTAVGAASSDSPQKIVVKHDSRSAEEVGRRSTHTGPVDSGPDLQSFQHPVETETREEVRQDEAEKRIDLDTSLNQKKMHVANVFYEGDNIPSPRKRVDGNLENVTWCFNMTMEDGQIMTQTISVTPFFKLFEMEPASLGRIGGGGRLEKERHARSDRNRNEKEWMSHRLKEDRYRKRPRSPPSVYHQRERDSRSTSDPRRQQRGRDSRSSSDPRRQQSSPEKSQKRVGSPRSPEIPRKKPKPGRESAEEGELTSEDDASVKERGRDAREYVRRRWGDRDEWRRHAVEERQNRRRKVSRTNDWSSDEGMGPGRSKADNQRRDEGRRFPQTDERLVSSSPRSNRAKIHRRGDSAGNEKSRHNRNKEDTESGVTRESSKAAPRKQSPSQHVALPPDVESESSRQSNISTVAVASNSSPENKFASSRSGLMSGKVRTRGGRTNRGHVRTMVATAKKKNGQGPKDKAPFDINNAQHLLRADLNVEDLLDQIHRKR